MSTQVLGQLRPLRRAGALLCFASYSAHYVGLEQVIGQIGTRAGSFVLQVTGSYDVETGLAKAAWSVVPGSGTEALCGLKGQGGFVAEHGKSEVLATLDYNFGY